MSCEYFFLIYQVGAKWMAESNILLRSMSFDIQIPQKKNPKKENYSSPSLRFLLEIVSVIS